MRHTSHLLSPARALHRILLLELSNAGKTATSSPYSFIRVPQFVSRRAQASPAIPTSLCHLRRTYSSTPTAKSQPLRDRNIPYQWVRIRGEDGKLSAPQRTESVLIALPKNHSLVMLAHPPPQDPNSATTVVQISAAVCRVVDTSIEREKAKAEKETALSEKQAAAQTKQLELSWAIASNDLSHKIKRLQEFLDKGARVEVLLARKKGGRTATPEEAEALIERVKEVAASVAGTTEYKKSDGLPGTRMTLFFEGPAANRKVKTKTKKPEYYESKIPSDYRPRESGQPKRFAMRKVTPKK